jgi:regulator of ribonuclease activity A
MSSSIPDTLTCDLCDAHRDDITGDFRVLPPVFQSYGGRTRFSGLVSTVQCFEDNAGVRAALEEPGHGRVLVVDGGASLRCALVGGNLGALALAHGWAGIVVNGCVRDVAELAVCDIGVRALGLMPMPPHKRSGGQRDVPVSIQGVWLRPGERLVADEDGMVVMRGV